MTGTSTDTGQSSGFRYRSQGPVDSTNSVGTSTGQTPNLLDNSGQNSLFGTTPPILPPVLPPVNPVTNPSAGTISKAALMARGITGASAVVVGTTLTVDSSFGAAWGLAAGGYLVTP